MSLCECGCGQTTNVARKSDKYRGHVRGEHVRFIAGHNGRRLTPWWIEEDHGFITPCWIWQAARNDKGYGLSSGYGSSGRLAHRVIYEQQVGKVPDGLELDHLCRNRACVNPAHLEPVTHSENMRRGYAVSARPAPMGFPAALRAARIAAGLSQYALADAVGCSQAAIALYERGKSSPCDQIAEALKTTLGLEVSA